MHFGNWQAFFHTEAASADAQGIMHPQQGPLSLNCGVVVQPLSFALENDTIDLNTIRPGYTAGQEEGYAIAVTTICAAEAHTVNLGISTEWWMEIYLNGVLVGSTREIGNGTPDFTPRAHIYALHLSAGTNTLAVWLHHSPWYDHWPFAAAILPEAPKGVMPLDSLTTIRKTFWPDHERIVAGPFLKAADGRMQVQAELFQPFAAILQLRRKGDAEWRELTECVLGQLPTDTHHLFDLPDLVPGEDYEYRLKTADTSLAAEEFSPVYSFHTPSAERPTHRFFCTADLQMSREELREILKNFFVRDASQADLFCTLGDMNNSSEYLYQDYFVNILGIALERTGHRQVFLPVRGNHELRGTGSTDWLKLLGSSYYLFRYGDTAYLVLDSGDDKGYSEPPHVYVRRTNHQALFQAEREWLLQTVETPAFQTARHRIILCHATPFDQDADDSDEFHEQFTARNLQWLLGDLFYGPKPCFSIDLWLAGHVHRSTRYTPQDQRIVSFLEPGSRHLTERERGLYPFPIVTLDGEGSIGPCQASGILLTVSPETIELVARQPNGEIIDRLRIHPDHAVEVLETALH